jgi:ADP-ribose pyrophosphatase YjhB (NUDIX family)
VTEWVHLQLLRLYRRLPRRARRGVVRRVAPTFTVGATCLIERADGRVLLIRQSYRNHWGLPGGLLQRREHPAAAARREIREEVGLDITLVSEPAVVIDAVPRRIDIVYRARPTRDSDADTARPTSVEIVEAGWFSPTELPDVQRETSQALQALARASLSPPARPLPA